MSDDERGEETADENAAEQPQAAEPEGVEPEAESPAEPEAPTAPPPAEPEAPTAPPPAEDAEATDDDAPDDSPAPDDEPAPAAAAAAKEEPKAKDRAPGADLEPLQLEPERELDAEERARLEAEEEERARLEALAAAVNEPVSRTGPRVELAKDAQVQATGKRKSAIARVILRAGSGEFEVNGHSLERHFPRAYLQTIARQSLVTAGYESNVDVVVRVHGGGISGQAAAVRHGIARGLCEIDPELRPELKRRGLLTRDARKKERRKAGLKKARKRPQFSKR